MPRHNDYSDTYYAVLNEAGPGVYTIPFAHEESAEAVYNDPDTAAAKRDELAAEFGNDDLTVYELTLTRHPTTDTTSDTE